MKDDTERSALGDLIEQKRNEMRPRLSARKAAERAGLSEGRWRQIVKGYQAAGGGRIPVNGPAETVARMAQVVGVTADELENAGRSDAADVMREALNESADVPEWAEWSLQRRADWTELLDWVRAFSQAEGAIEWSDPPTSALQFFRSSQLLQVLAEREERRVVLSQRHYKSLGEARAQIQALNRELVALRNKAASEPTDRSDVALAADAGDDAAGESESYNET